MASDLNRQRQTDFYLVRHAPVIKPAGVTAGWLYGWTDLEADVSDTAKAQAISAKLPADAQVVTSDLKRTHQTASALGLSIDQQEIALREQHFGDWENTPLSDLDADHPIWQNPHGYTPPNGEAWTDLRARVADWLSGFEPKADKVIIVAHAGSLRALLATMLDIPDDKALAVHLDTLSLSTVRHFVGAQGSGWRINAVNWNP